MKYLLALDQGTTSSRAILFDAGGQAHAVAQREYEQLFPQPGWVEHRPGDIWSSQSAVMAEVFARAGVHAGDIEAIGITNQRETTLLWDRKTGEPVCNAIVWQDRRTASICERLRADGAAPLIQARTGLVIDPYFSGTKLQWMLDHIDGARARAERGGTRLRHRGFLAHLESYRGPAACDRRHQRLAHAALRYPSRLLGR